MTTPTTIENPCTAYQHNNRQRDFTCGLDASHTGAHVDPLTGTRWRAAGSKANRPKKPSGHTPGAPRVGFKIDCPHPGCKFAWKPDGMGGFGADPLKAPTTCPEGHPLPKHGYTQAGPVR